MDPSRGYREPSARVNPKAFDRWFCFRRFRARAWPAQSRPGGGLGGAVGAPSEVLALVRALVLGAQALELLGVEAHAEREAHLAEDRLDLVERLLAEVLRLQELGLGLLHEIGDGPNVVGLQTVRGADGELALVHVAEEVLVQLGPRPRLVSLGRLLLRRRLGAAREQRAVALEGA